MLRLVAFIVVNIVLRLTHILIFECCLAGEIVYNKSKVITNRDERIYYKSRQKLVQIATNEFITNRFVITNRAYYKCVTNRDKVILL